MELSFKTRDDELIIEVSGCVDRHASGRLFDVLVGAINAGRASLVIDLSGALSVTRAGARGLIIAARFATTKHTTVSLEEGQYLSIQ